MNQNVKYIGQGHFVEHLPSAHTDAHTEAHHTDCSTRTTKQVGKLSKFNGLESK